MRKLAAALALLPAVYVGQWPVVIAFLTIAGVGYAAALITEASPGTYTEGVTS